jgi:hypothetical protein
MFANKSSELRRMKMNKKILIPIFILVLTTLACSLGGSKATSEAPTLPPPPTQEPIQQPTEVQIEPTLPPPPTEEIAPTEMPTEVPQPTEEPTPVCQPFYLEEFDQPSLCWPSYIEDMITITDITNLKKVSAGVDDGMLKFKFDLPEDIYLYSFNSQYDYDEVILQASIQKIEPSVNQNGFTLACHVNDYGWYEARIESGGTYKIFQYDALKRERDENPYVFITEGGTPAVRIGAGRENIIRWECGAKSLALIINDKEVWFENFPNLNSGGYVGIGMASYAHKLPIQIGFDNVEIIQP